MNAPLLEVRDLNVWFRAEDGSRVHAVRGVSFTLDAAERAGLVGESGCGKTTTVLALLGLLPQTAEFSGEVLLDGTDIMAEGEDSVKGARWTEMAMVFQGAMNAFNPVRRVGSQIAEALRVRAGLSRQAAQTRARELLELVGIPADRVRSYPHEFSGGMRQRAAIALALACEPKVLLADEPTTALDVMVQAQIVELLRRLCDEQGLALLMVSHDLPLIAEVCCSLNVMYAGEIIERGPVTDLYRSPAHPYTRLLLAATPDIVDVTELVSIKGAPPALNRPITGCPFRPRCDRAFDGARPRPRCSTPSARAGGRLPSQRPGAHGPPAEGEPMTAATAGTDTPLLAVDGLVAEYRAARSLIDSIARRRSRVVHAVDDVSFELRRGEMLGLVGESGCGKTTTAQTVLRLIEPVAGSITFGGEDITHLDQRQLRRLRQQMQLVYQDPYESLNPRYRVRQVIEEPLRIHGIGTKRTRTEMVNEALARVELNPPGCSPTGSRTSCPGASGSGSRSRPAWS